MNYDQFRNLSCYEEFEIQCDLLGISKSNKFNVLKEIGHQIDDYYFFISHDGIFNWFDLVGNHIEDPGVLTELKAQYIPKNIIRCVIPDAIYCINNCAFYGCMSLKEITIPDSVIRIGYDAFTRCESLKEITIPDSVTSINYGTFDHCLSLKEITISNSVTSIGDSVFYNCKSLKEITIPDSVMRIGDSVFYNCKSLKEITIPDSVVRIGDSVFAKCKSLKEVIFKGKTLKEVKRMLNYPFGIKDESIIKCEK